ncbi:permease [Neobacillus sp. NRS-1170]|uniref:permease n=1 Tax=Neobacillus sp. NRS-1170 TaxID=3233898 RepID=UPI003D2DD1DB
MFAGHFGLAAAVKAKQPSVPLWALMISTQLLDIIFVPLFISGVETMESIGNGGKEILIHAEYTHSLFGALLIACLAGVLAWIKWGKRGGMVISATVFSHWILDLIVHRADLPIFPGNMGGLPMLGLGLWKWPVVSLSLEAAMITLGAILYFRTALTRRKTSSPTNTNSMKNAIFTGTLMGILLLLSLIVDNI